MTVNSGENNRVMTGLPPATVQHPHQQFHDASHPAAIPVVLFGYGEWSRQKWLPELVQLARWGVLDLTLVERWLPANIPAELAQLEQEGVLRYLPWDDCLAMAAHWRAAYVVTSAAAHHSVIHALLARAASLRVIVCEKPCGEDLNQALEIYAACQQRSVALLMADHYLLRPAAQYLLAHPKLLRAIGQPVQITAAINETKSSGPQQSVIADLLVHLLDLLLTLFPGAHFTPATAYTAQALDCTGAGHATYTLAVGSLHLADGLVVPCELEGGKQLAIDNKSITVIGTQGELSLDLLNNALTLRSYYAQAQEVKKTWKPNWSYARLILKSLALSTQNPEPSCRM